HGTAEVDLGPGMATRVHRGSRPLAPAPIPQNQLRPLLDATELGRQAGGRGANRLDARRPVRPGERATSTEEKAVDQPLLSPQSPLPRAGRDSRRERHVRVPRLGVTAVCTAIAITVAAVRLLAPVPLEVLDRKFLDFRHLIRGPLAASDQIVIVAIDETSLARLGRWPWPRARLAELVERLDAAGGAAIGFDVLLDQPVTSVDRRALEAVLDADPQRSAGALRDVVRDQLDDDARLASALRHSAHVALAHFFEFGGSAPPDLLRVTAALPELTVLAVAG